MSNDDDELIESLVKTVTATAGANTRTTQRERKRTKDAHRKSREYETYIILYTSIWQVTKIRQFNWTCLMTITQWSKGLGLEIIYQGKVAVTLVIRCRSLGKFMIIIVFVVVFCVVFFVKMPAKLFKITVQPIFTFDRIFDFVSFWFLSN